MEPIEVLESLFDKKILKIIQFFLKYDDKEFYLRELSNITRVPPATTFRILNKLVLLNILNVREIKTAKLYKLSSDKTVDFLKSIMEVDVVQLFCEEASKMSNVDEILLIGKKEKLKANVLVLGQNINTNDMKLLTGEIKQKYNFTINQMTIDKAQYEQMSSMGLYPGSKKVLFKKV
jgi:hypothetical protein